ncbi:NADH dehydrogenase [ubiquinone] 1 alpha subcomplex assembly factor 8 isoform X1 [Lutra lutra]|uniref:NADH dehydrogenase [ubiquinone] 1 alpha subcomplex assembly factor 8 isoform X1 n=1 Tax=Lutra lutra TaxID=9657 RepID=UPI001FD2F994|nr:NADH dehydrogenase [ubiquinone] 1 alpha subcomplex assembly factor 8 isoform X1 [Lutra lutra]
MAFCGGQFPVPGVALAFALIPQRSPHSAPHAQELFHAPASPKRTGSGTRCLSVSRRRAPSAGLHGTGGEQRERQKGRQAPVQRVPGALSLGECSALGRSLLCQEPEGRPLGWTSQHGTSVCCPRKQSPAAPTAPKGKWRKHPKHSELRGLGPGASWCSCAACVRVRVSVRPREATIKSRVDRTRALFCRARSTLSRGDTLLGMVTF